MPRPQDPERLMIRREEQEAARKARPPVRRWPPSPRAPVPRVRALPTRPPPLLALGRENAPALRLPGTLTAARLKVSATLDAVELLAVPVPEGRPRMTLRISLPDRTLTAEIASKSLRKAQTAIREAGPDDIALALQGHLTRDRRGRRGRTAEGCKTGHQMTRTVITHEIGGEGECGEAP